MASDPAPHVGGYSFYGTALGRILLPFLFVVPPLGGAQRNPPEPPKGGTTNVKPALFKNWSKMHPLQSWNFACHAAYLINTQL